MMIVGIIEGEENIVSMPFKNTGNHILLIGETKAELGGSEYHSIIYGIEGGIPPKVDEKQVKATWDFLFQLYENNLVKASHDINKGGLIITVAEMCFKNNIGANLNFKGGYNEDLRDDEFLFSESVGRFIIETSPNDYKKLIDIASKFNVEAKKIGVLIPESIIDVKGLKEEDFILDIRKMKELYDSTIPNLMEI